MAPTQLTWNKKCFRESFSHSKSKYHFFHSCFLCVNSSLQECVMSNGLSCQLFEQYFDFCIQQANVFINIFSNFVCKQKSSVHILNGIMIFNCCRMWINKVNNISEFEISKWSHKKGINQTVLVLCQNINYLHSLSWYSHNMTKNTTKSSGIVRYCWGILIDWF